MKLNLEQIKKVTNGVARVEEKDGLIVLSRFTEEQQKLYERVSEDFYKKTYCTAGVNLRFKTNSENLKLEFLLDWFCSRRYFAVEILVDGKVHTVYKNYQKENMVGAYATQIFEFSENNEILCQLGKGEKEIEILLPWNFNFKLKGLYLDNGASLEPIKRPKTWLIYGDSITQGYDAILPENRYVYRVCKHFNAEELNKAIGGEIAREELGLLKDEINPEVITIAYGTNDWGRGELSENFYKEYVGLLKNLKKNYPNAKMFAITPIWRLIYKEERPFGPFELIAELIKKAVEEVGGINYIYGFDLVPKEKEYFGDLALHPSDEGFIHYANNLIKEIEKYL